MTDDDRGDDQAEHRDDPNTSDEYPIPPPDTERILTDGER